MICVRQKNPFFEVQILMGIPLEITEKRIPCKALLFDLDGVLIDSTGNIMRHWQVWADRNCIDMNTINRVAHGLQTIETMRRVAPHLNVEKEAFEFAANEFEDTDGIVAIAGAHELLSGLPPESWTIVTSGCLKLVEARMAKTGLPKPENLVSADDVKQGKPAPDAYLLGARRLGVEPARCVVFEDAPAGIEAGKKAGMRVVAITSTHNRGQLVEAGADFIVSKLTDLSVTRSMENGSLIIHLLY